MTSTQITFCKFAAQHAKAASFAASTASAQQTCTPISKASSIGGSTCFLLQFRKPAGFWVCARSSNVLTTRGREAKSV